MRAHPVSFGAIIVGSVLVVPLMAAETYRTHPPMRPLPAATKQPLANGTTFFVDAAKGDDKQDGSQAKPWKTIQHGVKRLKPGETLYLRGGTYYEKVHLTRSGTAESPIVIASYPGEMAVVDGGLREFLDSPETSWEPLRDGAAGEFVSTKSYAHLDERNIPHQFLPAAWEPMWGIEDERPLAPGQFADSMVPLHGYRNAADLRATNELALADRKSKSAGVYCGPGMWFNRESGRIHIRLAHHQMPGLGDRAYRGETDPRKLPLVVSAGFGGEVFRVHGVRHVRIRGIVFRGATGSPMVHVYGSENIELDHLSVFGGFPALLVNASKNLRVTHSAFRGLAAPWTGRSHMKYYGTASYQIVFQNSQPGNENIEFAHCEFTDDHDFAFFRYVKNLQFHHNFVDNFNDDGLECGSKLRSHSMFIHQNRIGACLGVFQQHEIDKDESPVQHDPKSGVYVFRNVFDARGGVYYGLPAKEDPTGEFLHSEGHFLSDHGSPTYPVMRVYHNTLLRNTPVYRNYFLFGLGAVGLRNTERDVFNNLMVQSEGVPGTVILGKEAENLREGGNMLWGIKDGPLLKGDPFAKFRAGALFTESRKRYEAGWTTHDRVADPMFHKFGDGDLRLREGSPAINGGRAIPKEWPDPLRDGDKDGPDIGALPLGASAWGVGVDGRISLFGGMTGGK